MKKYLMTLLFTASVIFGQSKPEINIACSVYQGFNFQNDTQDNVGHVTVMKLGTSTELAADFSVVDPEDYPNQVDVIGVMSSFFWTGNYFDPIILSCQISAANKTAVKAFTLSGSYNTDVIFDLNVYSYDPQAKTYFKMVCKNIPGNLQGIITEEGGDLLLHISDDPGSEVSVPWNYQMDISIDPQEITQALLIGTNATSSFSKIWGTGITTVPVLVSPSAGTITTDRTPAFDWADTPGALSYTLQVDNNSDFSSPEINTSQAVSTYTPSSDLSAGTYYWRVKANNASGSSDYSGAWDITIELIPPDPPIVIEPPFTGTLLRWNAVTGATGYDIYSSDDPYGTYTFVAHVTTTEYDISGALLTENKKFYYIVATN